MSVNGVGRRIEARAALGAEVQRFTRERGAAGQTVRRDSKRDILTP